MSDQLIPNELKGLQDCVTFPAKNKFQTEESVLQVVNNGKASLTKSDFQSVVYAAYQINAIQDLITTGYKGFPVVAVEVRKVEPGTPDFPIDVRAVNGENPKIAFDFTYRYTKDPTKPNDYEEYTETKYIDFPLNLKAERGDPGPPGERGPAGPSVYIVYGTKTNDPDFTETWTIGQKWIGIKIAEKNPEVPLKAEDYTWSKFIDKHIVSLDIVNTDNQLQLKVTWDDKTETLAPIKETACVQASPAKMYIGVAKINEYVVPKDDTQVIIKTGYFDKQEGKTLTLDKGVGTVNSQTPINGNIDIKTGFENKNEAGIITLDAGVFTVNNTQPVKGNVTIDTGVMKVNGKSPTEGNITIDTGVMKVNGTSPTKGNVNVVGSIKVAGVKEPYKPDASGLTTIELPKVDKAVHADKATEIEPLFTLYFVNSATSVVTLTEEQYHMLYWASRIELWDDIGNGHAISAIGGGLGSSYPYDQILLHGNTMKAGSATIDISESYWNFIVTDTVPYTIKKNYILYHSYNIRTDGSGIESEKWYGAVGGTVIRLAIFK